MSLLKIDQPQSQLEIDSPKSKLEKAHVITARDTEATYFDKNGILRTVAPHEVRYSKNFDTGKQDLLLEEESTNLFETSEDFSSHYWNKLTSIVEESSIVAPDDTQNTIKYVQVDGYVYKILRNNSDAISGKRYASSFFVKQGNYNLVSFRLGGSETVPTFNFETETWFYVQDYTVNSITLPNGWYRLSVSRIIGDNKSTEITICEDGDESKAITGKYHYVFGAQFEQGYPSSYIPTNGAPVTRPADKLVFAS